MDEWRVETADPSIDRYVDELPPLTRHRVERLKARLGAFGNLLGPPQTRSLGDGLFELRTSGKDAQRIYYTFRPGRRIVILHVGSKKTQKRDIAIARQRLGG